MAQLVKITLHPDDDSPVYGFAQYQSDDRDDEHDGRFTMRTDPERLLGAKQHLDQGATVHLAGGSWNQRPGWPEDWEDGHRRR